MYCKTVIVGHLSRDIELRYSQSGSAIANTAIASTHKFTHNGERKEEVMFIDITFFGRSAEVANMYLRKGSKILVEGRLKLDQWVAQDGSKRSKHSIIVETMTMLDSKSDDQSNSHDNHNVNNYQESPQQDHRAYQPQMQQGHEQHDMPNHLPGIDMDEDEIPF